MLTERTYYNLQFQIHEPPMKLQAYAQQSTVDSHYIMYRLHPWEPI